MSHKLIVRLAVKPLLRRRFHRLHARSRKRLVRYSLLGANLGLLLVVVLFVAKSPTSSQTIHHDAVASVAGSSATIAGPLDQVSSADIAVHIARTVGLPEAVSVVNHADTVSAVEATAPADSSVVGKPQVASAVLPSRKDIQTYIVQPGDTVSSIATKLGVSSENIRGSNNLTGDRVAIGKVLTVPPKGTNGIVYTVKAGDTAETLAQKFNTTKEAIISFNDAEVAGLTLGEQIMLPDGVVPAQAVFASYSTPTSYNSGFAWGGNSPVYNSNGYDYGWCTWHAANRRRELGRPIPSNLGNANSWIPLARSAGLAVGSVPQDGAVFSQSGTGYLGHVGIVEKVNEDGSFQASDMNYPIWGRVTYRTVSAAELGSYKFIY